MPSSINSPEDLVNICLARVGFKGRIGSLYEGSAAAKKILDLYSQTRDEFLRSNDPDFAERTISMTLLKSAPAGGYFAAPWNPATNPAPPWAFQYVYPADSLKVRSVRPQPLFVQDFDPQPFVFSIENDNTYSPAVKAILCNVSNALLVYTAQITDLSTWEADSLEAFAAALGRRLAPTFANMDAVKLEAADEQASTTMADEEQG